MNDKKVSIVMCTFNGERFLRRQLDTIVGQTYPLYEIIIQDDGSTDGTWEILEEYARNHRQIKLFHNTDTHGVNGNFFSAMQKATGELIAISDQDDVWELKKIEKMVDTIGDNLLCSCRTKPFSEDGSHVDYDERIPNYHLPRLLYASVLGHSMLFRRELLKMTPDISDSYYDTVYDVILGTTAAACGQIVVCNEVLVHQRRYAEATTISKFDFDKRRTPSVKNGLYILFWSLFNYWRVRPYMQKRFQVQCTMLKGIKNAFTEEYRDSIFICELEGKRGINSLIQLSLLFIKHRHHLFYTEGKGIVLFLRATLYPIMQAYDYRSLLSS